MELFLAYLRRQAAVHALLLIIIGLGVAVRTVDFPLLPPGFNQDEAASGYEAFALAATGKDKWGNAWPAYFEAWGSGQNVLLAYLMVPVIKVLGLSVFSVRLVPLLLGILSLPLFYYCLRPLGRYPALLGLFMLAVAPWHFMMSRWALESNLVPFFMLLGCATVLRALRTGRRRWIVPALLPFALALYAYGTTAAVLPLLLLLATPFLLPQLRPHWGAWLLALGLFLVVAFPFLLFFAENYLLHRNLPWSDQLFFSTPLLPANRLDQVANNGAETLMQKNMRFLQAGFDDQTNYNVLPGFKPLLNFTVLLTVLALLTFLHRSVRLKLRAYAQPANQVVVLFAAWALACIPLFYSFELNVNRFNHLYLPCLALSVWFINLAIRHFDETVPKRLVRVLVFGWVIIEGKLAVQSYLEDYADQSRIKQEFNYGLEEAFAATSWLGNVSQIKVSGQMPLPYVYTLFFTQYPPAQFQREHAFWIHDDLYWVEHVGKFYFNEQSIDRAKDYGYLCRPHEYLDTTAHRRQPVYTSNEWEVGVMKRK